MLKHAADKSRRGKTFN